MNPYESLKLTRFCSVALVLLAACGSPESNAVDPLAGLIDDDPIELLDDSPEADGLRTKSGKFREDPIVFTHGCPLPDEIGSGTNSVTSTFWKKIYDRFVDEHYPAAAWTDPKVIPGSTGEHPSTVPSRDQYLNVFVYDLKDEQGRDVPCGGIAEYARQLAEYVDEVREATGSRRVDIVANSFGTMATRLYIKRSGGKWVRDVVILAGTNHGTDTAFLAEEANPLFDLKSPRYDGARELRPAYSCDPESVQFEINGCVVPVRTDGVNETPYDNISDNGPIAYLNIFNVAVDELVTPTLSACLNQQFPGDCRDPINVPIQVATQAISDTAGGSPDTPHGSIRQDDQAISPTIAFVMKRNRVRR